MNLIVQFIELNCYALIILFFVFRNVRRQDRQYFPDQRLFLSIICAVAAMLLLDTLMWMIDGRPGRIFRILSSGAMVAYNALNPVICLLWYLYVDFYIFGSRKRMRSYMHFLLIPVAFNLVLSVVSVFGNIYFVLDEYNTYHRGKYIIILMIICLIYVIATSLLPIGLFQFHASVTEGLWYARSEAFLQQPFLQTLRWVRTFGDVVFIVGALAVAWQVVSGLFGSRIPVEPAGNYLAGARR